MDEHQPEEFRVETLLRENSYLLRVVGGLGAVVVLLIGGYFSFWANALSDKTLEQQKQITHLWEISLQRGERVLNIEAKQAATDALTTEITKDLRTLELEMNRLKVRLKIEDR